MSDESYWGDTLFSFFQTLASHFLLWMRGKYSLLASDELQLIILSLIGISCALVGTFLIVRKMAMVANAISHTVLIGIVLSYIVLGSLFSSPMGIFLTIDIKTLLLSSFFSSLLTIGLIEFLNRVLRLSKDSSIGLVFTTLFALGIILVTIFTRNSHIGAELIMGNVDLCHKDDIIPALILALVNIFLVILLYRGYVITAFDSHFAHLSGISNRAFTYLLILQTSASLIVAFRVVGVVLVLALIVLPPVTAKLIVNRLKSMIFLAMGISIMASLIALALARHMLTVYNLALSTSGLIVTVLFLLWFIVVLAMATKKVWIRLHYQNVMKAQRGLLIK